MLFTGEYEHVIDAKQRLAIPAEVRSMLDPEVHGSGFYLAPGWNDALWLWPEREFERTAESINRQSGVIPAEEFMLLQEYWFSQAHRLEVDKAGRVRLPERLMALGRLSSSVVILGVGNHLELRNPEEWRARLSQATSGSSQVIARVRDIITASGARDRPPA